MSAGIVLVRNKTPFPLKRRSVKREVVNVLTLLKRATPKLSNRVVATSVPPIDRLAKNPVVLKGTPFLCTHSTVNRVKIGPVLGVPGLLISVLRTILDRPESDLGGVGHLAAMESLLAAEYYNFNVCDSIADSYGQLPQNASNYSSRSLRAISRQSPSATRTISRSSSSASWRSPRMSKHLAA